MADHTLRDTMSFEKLNGENFPIWKLKMQAILVEKDLWPIVIGEIEPSEGDAAKIWIKQDNKARALIQLSLSDNLLLQISKFTTSKAMWGALVDLFESKIMANKLYLKRKLMQLKMNEGDSLTNHLSSMQALLDQLAAIGVETNADEAVMTILGSLPPSYDYYTSIVSSLVSGLSVTSVSALLIQEELRRGKSKDAVPVEAALFSKDKSKHKFKGKSANSDDRTKAKNKEKCPYCHKLGHAVSKCWKKAYDDSVKGQSSSNQETDLFAQFEEDIPF